jgi:nifR3 family TIM-barrel protein
VPPRAWLAPLSGVTDAAFRTQALRFGAPAVVSEMVAGEMLVAGRSDVTRRARRHDAAGLWIVQLAGRRPQDMFESARQLSAAGVDVIDINMGCPSRQVTHGASGSALMRVPDLAKALVEATLKGANGVPVTLKMRLGWDDGSLNAPALAQMGEAAGLAMLTVHGRTRCQFYTGRANWAAVRDSVDAVRLPVIVNGDIDGVDAARAALAASGAHGVMVGRAAMGRPWLIGQIAAALAGESWVVPELRLQVESLIEQVEDSASLYGSALGLRMVRKHVAAAVDVGPLGQGLDEAARRTLRGELCRLEGVAALTAAIAQAHREDLQAAA